MLLFFFVCYERHLWQCILPMPLLLYIIKKISVSLCSNLLLPIPINDVACLKMRWHMNVHIRGIHSASFKNPHSAYQKSGGVEHALGALILMW